MKYLIFLIVTFLLLSAKVDSQSKDVYVKGYYRKDGTYVQPHYRTSPNSTNTDNYSTRGNTNPYTGKKGTVPPDTYQKSLNNSNNIPTLKYDNKIKVYTCSPIYATYNLTHNKEITKACEGYAYVISKVNNKYYKVVYNGDIGFIKTSNIIGEFTANKPKEYKKKEIANTQNTNKDDNLNIMYDNPTSSKSTSTLYTEDLNFRIKQVASGKIDNLDITQWKELSGLLLFNNDGFEIVIKDNNTFIRMSDYITFEYEDGSFEIQADYYWKEVKKKVRVYTLYHADGLILIMVTIDKQDVILYNVDATQSN